MPRFKLQKNLSPEEIMRRSRQETRLEMAGLQAPSLTGHMAVTETMWSMQFKSTGISDDGTAMFARGETDEIFIRRDWNFPGVAYDVCCWSAIGRPSLRIANAHQLRRAVRKLLAIQAARRYRHAVKKASEDLSRVSLV